ncbi:MAG: hypothetical protein HQK52_17035 [Oligoflexia bacterium]|nr:hypothetical protein [Oligoflexia bacterium]
MMNDLIEKDEIMNKGNWYYNYVYIEDDEYERSDWKRNAKKKNINALILTSTKEFEMYADNISKNKTLIYLDCDLGEGELRGDEFAEKLHAEGYLNLYMSTSYDAEEFAHLPWLKYAGKGCPFEKVNSG